MKEDKKYCMNSFLMFRTIADSEYTFDKRCRPQAWKEISDRVPIHDSIELEAVLRQKVGGVTAKHKAAIALSGGIDSAILAKFMPKGSVAYTFKCIVPGIEVTDETFQAAIWAKECGLEHRVVEIYWEDMLQYAPILMEKKGAPIHSIEVQIYKAALQAKADGFDSLIFGETADALYGGLSGLLSKDWTVGEFVDRYSYVRPYYVLRSPSLILEPFLAYEEKGYINVHKFLSEFFYRESLRSYTNATECADLKLCAPYAETFFSDTLDLERIRNGENKYVVREIFKRLYPDMVIPPKTPMPRPTNEWLKTWGGPKRDEFLPNCIKCLTGDQKWLLFALEMFLNMLEKGNINEAYKKRN